MWRCIPLFLLVLAACGRGQQHPTLAIGAAAPEFSLVGADGTARSLADFTSSPVLVVVFTCNHCPVAQLYEARVQRLHDDYRNKGVAVVAINSDSPVLTSATDLTYTDVGDTLEGMKVRTAHRRLTYPYLYDGDDQAAAIAFGVVATPQMFVFDRARQLRYRGRIDDNLDPAAVTVRHARNAIEALLAGRPVATESTEATGCPVRWLTARPDRRQEGARLASESVSLEMAGPEQLTALRGNGTSKLMLVNFWATWCGPCVSEFPDLVETYRMYRGRNVEFVTVSVNDPTEKDAVLAFLKKQQASGRNLQFATDDISGLQTAFDPMMPASVPFTVLIAPDGDVVYQELGASDIPRLRRAILATLPDDENSRGARAYWAAGE